MKKRKIAFFLDYLEAGNMFQFNLLDGILSAMPEAGVELYVVAGGSIGNHVLDRYSDERNKIYELITKEHFDGIIVSTSVGTFASGETVEKYLEKFAGIPIVFFGPGPAGYHQVIVDNRTGMKSVVGHLIRDHKYSRIAFITGPDGNVEAEERFAAYRDELTAAGIEFDPSLVYHGHFTAVGGKDAVTELLDVRRKQFDAIIASNDQMALRSMKELDRRGIAIPTVIAVAGFDDTVDASSSTPALTTARQPFTLMGKKVFGNLMALMNGNTVAERENVPAELVIRQSCGCLSAYAGNDEPVGGQADGPDRDAFFEARKAVFLEELGRMQFGAHADKVVRQAERLFDLFYDQILKNKDESPPNALYEIIDAAAKNTDVECFQAVLTLTRKLLFPLLAPGEVLEKAESFFHSARMIVTDILIAQKKREIIESLRHRDLVSIMSEILANIVEMTQLREVLYRTIPSLSIRNFLAAEYVPGADGKESASLIALIRDGVAYDGEELVYSPDALFPSETLAFDSRLFFVMPLLCQGERLGYVIFDDTEEERTSYVVIARDIAKSIYICRLIKQRKDVEASLEHRNRELQDFAHVASHDLQEPLKKIAVFGEKLACAFREKATPDELDYVKRLLHATVRMQDLITGLLAYSRVSVQVQSVRRLDLGSVIAEVLTDLEVRINETRGRVDLGRMPKVVADPLQMRQLFQNLIGNALKYHKDGVPPHIRIESVSDGEYHTITIADNGIGFDNKNSERIFGIFQRAVGKNEYEGTGVGLAICKKIVERQGGSITASSEQGKGSVFTLRLPVKPKT